MNENAPSSDQAPLLELIDVRKAYASVEDGSVPDVLKGVSLTIEAGSSLSIIGPSGCGKSTLLNIIGALIRPTSGTVRFQGQDVYAKTDAELAEFRNRCIGFVFQSHHLLPQCSALENVLIPTLANPDRVQNATAPDRAVELLRRVGLGDRIAHRPAQMSGGECQRVAVVRALINQPKLVLADEPTGSLDEESADQLSRLLAELNREHDLTLMTVTHSLRLASRMQRGFELRRGVLEPWNPNE